MTAPLPSKEQLIADIAHAEEKAATLCGPCADDHARLAYWLRALLAAYEQEPVAYMIGGHYLMHADDPKVDNYTSAVPLYTHPAPSIPAPQGDFDFDRYNDIVWLDAVASQPAVHGVTAATVATLAIELNRRLDAAVLSIPAVLELASVIAELTSAIRSINRAPHHIAKGVDDDEPCYWQRKEWIDWILELASIADEKSRAAMLNGGKS